MTIVCFVTIILRNKKMKLRTKFLAIFFKKSRGKSYCKVTQNNDILRNIIILF